MTTEEKARAYDEAVKIARCWLNDPQTIQDCNYTIEDAIQNIFPELRESEDERIRKEMIAYFAHRADVTEFIDEGEDCKRWISYLEKQKEQKPAEWSEEDERMLSRCIKSIECSKMFAEAKTFKDAKDNEIDWLENRFKSLRPSWKPSEEQMEALMLAIEGKCPPTSYMSRRLEDLYDGLANTYRIDAKLD